MYYIFRRQTHNCRTAGFLWFIVKLIANYIFISDVGMFKPTLHKDEAMSSGVGYLLMKWK